MNSAQLAHEVEEVVKEAQARIIGVGQEQYAEGDQQKFEIMPFEDLLVYFEEELLDQINYAVMNLIRVRRLKVVLQELEKRVDELSRLSRHLVVSGQSPNGVSETSLSDPSQDPMSSDT